MPHVGLGDKKGKEEAGRLEAANYNFCGDMAESSLLMTGFFCGHYALPQAFPLTILVSATVCNRNRNSNSNEKTFSFSNGSSNG